MKIAIKALAVFLIALLSVPAFGQVNVNANSNTNANVNDDVYIASETNAEVKVKTPEIRWRQFKESLQDFGYNVRTKVTFSEESKVELIHDRNEQLKARQEAWVEYKNSILSSNATVDTDVRAAIKAKHEAIIREHVELTHRLNELKAQANARGNVNLEKRAEAELKYKERFKFGLGNDFILLLAASDEYRNMSVMTEAQIRAKVEAMGYNVVEAELEQEDGISIWHVTATKTQTVGSITIRSDVEINFEAKTGLILSVRGRNYNGNASSISGRVMSEFDDKMHDVDEIRKKIREHELDIEFESETETQTNSNSGSGSANSGSSNSGSNANVNANASASANGSGASAGANAQVGVGI